MSRMTMLVLSCVAASLCSVCLGASSQATPVDVTTIFHQRDVRGPNTTGLGSGDFLFFGAVNVVPNGDGGTTATAQQGTVSPPLPFVPIPVAPNLFANSVRYDSSFAGSWTLIFRNGVNTTVVQTPTVGTALAAPFVNSVAISGASTNPTFSWTLPALPPGFTADGIRIVIFDLAAPPVGALGVQPSIHVQNLPATATSFTVPAITSSGIPLQEGRRYSIAIGIFETTGHVPAPGGAIEPIVSRSRKFFDFVPEAAGQAPQVFLPSVGPDGAFQFDILVEPGQTYFIDPVVAIGYEYAIGADGPSFGSILLPNIGDGLFDLFLFNGTGFVFDHVLTAGVVHDFGAGGVGRFRILGIEASVGLDPADATAFVTGLTFTGPGRFTGTMTPLTTDVPMPPPLGLTAGGMLAVLIALQARRRHSKGSPSMPDSSG